MELPGGMVLLGHNRNRDYLSLAMIRAILVMAERQRAQVNRLVDYCKRLDGTEIEVIEYGQEDTWNRREAVRRSFIKACDLFQDEGFFWMEPDAIPLKPDWKNKIEEEHWQKEKPFTLPSIEGLSKFDHASGIGIYPPNVAEFVPREKLPHPYAAFDYWLYSKFPHAINFTRLIQHSYGVYSQHRRKIVRRHSFPMDNALIRDDALLWHSDKNQDLISNALRSPSAGRPSQDCAVQLNYGSSRSARQSNHPM
jgi:hypothetical protein